MSDLQAFKRRIEVVKQSIADRKARYKVAEESLRELGIKPADVNKELKRLDAKIKEQEAALDKSANTLEKQLTKIEDIL